MAKRGSAQGFTRLVLHAPDSATADPLVRKIPSGAAFIHLTDETPIAALRARASEVGMRPAWLFSLEPNEFADLRAHETRPVAPADAGQIAAAWAPDWPGAEAYVRRRIERGPSAGIALDGRLVAWALTHFLTDRVAMLGFFHVLEPHRGKGYAKSVASSLVREALALGKIPALHVFTDNEASLHLVDRLGFRRIRRQVWGDVVLR
jgi:RimJ/RimL family protein N-acetyltransferase